MNRVNRTDEWIEKEKKAILDVAETAEVFSRQKQVL